MTYQTYSEPALYDLAFSYRDYHLETSTLLGWFKALSHSDQNPVSFLELAAGPGRHSIEIASCGVHTVALDKSQEMAAYCQAIAAKQNAALGVVMSDMTSFKIDQSFDMIATLINSICHVLDPSQLQSHFEAVYHHLNHGGVYVIEALRYPSNVPPGESSWSKQTEHTSVQIRWSWDQSFDYVHMHGNVHGREVVIEEKFPMRRWRTRELVDAAMLANLKLVGYAGDFDHDPVDDLDGVKRLGNQSTMHSCFVFARS